MSERANLGFLIGVQGFHEVLNEPKAGDEIADQVADWLLARL